MIMKTTLVIKGAYYQAGNEILVPHFTGQYITVDCTRYILKKEWKENYSKTFRDENKNNFVEVEGVKYYYAEYSPMNINDDWNLLSDLSELEHIEEEFNF